MRSSSHKSYYNILKRVGSGSESGLLKSLAYTYAYNCNVNNVEILIDNKPYEGSHILYEEGEYIIVNFNDINSNLK